MMIWARFVWAKQLEIRKLACQHLIWNKHQNSYHCRVCVANICSQKEITTPPKFFAPPRTILDRFACKAKIFSLLTLSIEKWLPGSLDLQSTIWETTKLILLNTKDLLLVQFLDKRGQRQFLHRKGCINNGMFVTVVTHIFG